MGGSCDTFFDSQAFKNADATVKKAKAKKDEAKGHVSQAQKSLDAAIEAAKKAVKKCQCNTFQAHKKALDAANSKVKSANTKEWTKAAHLKCVLAGTSYKSCSVPAIPQVKAASVAAGVSNSACVNPCKEYKSNVKFLVKSQYNSHWPKSWSASKYQMGSGFTISVKVY